MTLFDLGAVGLLLLSAAVGYARGAVREIAAMFALLAAAVLAILGLPRTAPLAGRIIHTEWLAAIAALIVVFLVTYALLRLGGAIVAQRVQRTQVLGVLDRSLGLGIGLVRGLVVLGALYLMFNAATPQDLRPRWITGAATWPMARTMGQVLTRLAPSGFDAAGRLRPVFDRALKVRSGDKAPGAGYDARERGEIDDLVEKSR